jgi:DMSO/TMAO reductase YedYZ molybdopterin-dependent catalytic subunit
MTAASGPPEPSVPAGTDRNAPQEPATDHPNEYTPSESPTHGPGGPPKSNIPADTDRTAPQEPASDHPNGRTSSESPTHEPGGPPEATLPEGTDRNPPQEPVADHPNGHTPNESPTHGPGGPPESTLPEGTDRNPPLARVVHRFLPAPDSRLGRLIDRVQPPREADFRGAAHHEKVTARLGVWLGVAFVLCFVTGLLSHAVQEAWFPWPAVPANLYRITQGVHVIAGIAAIPLLLAKLWSVYPKLFARPLVRSLPHALERLSILVLSGAAFFELTTGLFNVTQNYLWGFYFPAAHYAVAWIAVGSVLVHVAVKLPVIRRALARLGSEPEPRPGMSRRAFLRTTYLTTGVAVVATAGATVPLLRDVSPLAWRSNRGPQGLPVNRTAGAARVTEAAADPAWRLEIVGTGRTVRLSLDELDALPQHTADLPIACVEGWSQSATWTGVPIADLLRLVDAPDRPVRVTSLERKGAYRMTELPTTHTRHTLLALHLNGERLALDHGFPCRIIAPSRPGVLQTKWVHRLEVL